MSTQYSPVAVATQQPPTQLFTKAGGIVTAASQIIHQRKIYRLPSVLMRSGTSRGLFIHRHHLPKSQSEWGTILIGALGSRNNDPRQLEGVGGATSTTSKAVVVSKSYRPGIDVEYTFIQITVGQEKVDMTGNCGNMASGIAAFALEEGLITARPGQSELSVRIYNTNTRSVLVETIQVNDSGHFLEDGEYHISGVKGTGSSIKVSFLNPGGSMTGKVFPTGNRQDKIMVHERSGLPEQFMVKATLIDVSNPFIFVDSSSLPPDYHATGSDSDIALDIIESIRRQGAVQFGLASDVDSAGLKRGTPKIAVISKPLGPLPGFNTRPDISVLAYSMGKVHPSVQLTGAVCLGAAACLEGTVVSELMKSEIPLSSQELTPLGTDVSLKITSEKQDNIQNDRSIVIGHSSGTIDVDVEVTENDLVQSVTVFRTARRLFEGTILVPL
ncbi:PrpF protein-domain-containing protein [Talaromyces proteolyticus]|uniref:PrpF protein-domain-containing protein n=1 Tax=Talaromyces proteolyticus TaxID=1131652 RepID=A0AAD4KRZ4_9EURO|nr:PrpF protein-domain-containing protein [Talaromyces proteolyticus]KAH8694217.1 PrpF protein-domain-containing protein [Talaromyces proteolyticus]